MADELTSAAAWLVHWCNEPILESAGHNRSPVIDAWNQAVGNPLGSPYCAAGVSAAFRKFAKNDGHDFPFSGGSQAIRHWFETRGLLSWNPQDILKWKGAVVGWTDSGGIHGHVFLAVHRLTDANGVLLRIGTAEANTSAATGGRDGEGCYELTREVPVDRGHKLWFCNVSDINGGDFGWT